MVVAFLVFYNSSWIAYHYCIIRYIFYDHTPSTEETITSYTLYSSHHCYAHSDIGLFLNMNAGAYINSRGHESSILNFHMMRNSTCLIDHNIIPKGCMWHYYIMINQASTIAHHVKIEDGTFKIGRAHV